jgi:hypothetical protein
MSGFLSSSALARLQVEALGNAFCARSRQDQVQ